MELTTVIVLVVLGVVLLYAIMLYNQLVSVKHAVSQAWSNIDVLLRQRHDELPKLVEACRRYMQHEAQTLERVIAARGAVASARAESDVKGVGRAETALRAGLGQLFALADRAGERDCRSPRTVQRGGKYQQRAHRAVSRGAAGAAVRVQTGHIAAVQ